MTLQVRVRSEKANEQPVVTIDNGRTQFQIAPAFTAAVTAWQSEGVNIGLEYLTVGHSNVLKLVYRLQNLTSAVRTIEAGWFVFAQPDGTSEHNALRSNAVERKATPWETWSDAGHCGIVLNPSTDRTLALISPYPRVRLIDWGAAGGHLRWFGDVNVAPKGTTERICYVVLCRSAEQAARYAWLAGHRWASSTLSS